MTFTHRQKAFLLILKSHYGSICMILQGLRAVLSTNSRFLEIRRSMWKFLFKRIPSFLWASNWNTRIKSSIKNPSINSKLAQIDEIWSASRYQLHYNSRIRRIWPENGKIKIVEFFDYECPFCQRIQPTLNEIHRRYPNDVAIIHRHFPLPYHSSAYPSAVASESANEQGKLKCITGNYLNIRVRQPALTW